MMRGLDTKTEVNKGINRVATTQFDYGDETMKDDEDWIHILEVYEFLWNSIIARAAVSRLVRLEKSNRTWAKN